MTDVRRTKTPTETIKTSVSHLLGFDCVAAEKALLVRPSVMQCSLDSNTFHRMGLCVRPQCSHIVIKKKNHLFIRQTDALQQATQRRNQTTTLTNTDAPLILTDQHFLLEKLLSLNFSLATTTHQTTRNSCH